MLYTQQSFTCPAAGSKTTQQRWDLAFLAKHEFMSKYNVTDEQYAEIVTTRQESHA